MQYMIKIVFLALIAFVMPLSKGHAQSWIDGGWQIDRVDVLKNLITSKEDMDRLEELKGHKLFVSIKDKNIKFEDGTVCYMHMIAQELLSNGEFSASDMLVSDWGEIGFQPTVQNPNYYQASLIDSYCPDPAENQEGDGQDSHSHEHDHEHAFEEGADYDRATSEQRTIYVGNGGNLVVMNIYGYWVELKRLQSVAEPQDVVGE